MRRVSDYSIQRDDVRALLKQRARKFRRGDVVTYTDDPELFGIVTTGGIGIVVAWADGARSGGCGLLFRIHRLEPRKYIPVPKGALGNRGWNREQAVTAALRRAGIEVRT